MRFTVAVSLFCLFLPLYHDIDAITRFEDSVEIYRPLVEEALSKEKRPSDILPESLLYICKSGCYQDIDSETISYSLRARYPLYLSGSYLEKDFLYYRI